MKSRVSTWIAAISLFIPLAMPVRAAAQEESVAQEPKAGLSGKTQEGEPFFIKFDVPGAGTGSGQGTLTAGINPVGTISGNYFDANTATHGDLRAPDGTITKYDVPGAGTGYRQGTVGGSINPAGEIAGYYVDDSTVFHGYVRDPDGAITRYDVPGAGRSSGQGTFPFVNSPSGEIAGFYVDANNVSHGFLRISCQSDDVE